MRNLKHEKKHGAHQRALAGPVPEEFSPQPASAGSGTVDRKQRRMAARAAQIRAMITGTAHLQRLLALAYPGLAHSQQPEGILDEQ